jgi:uracil phosphoribosyltransferase
MKNVTIIQHPLVQDKLTIMRNKQTDSGVFRLLMNEVSLLLCYEATRDLSTYLEQIETPMHITGKFPMVKSKDLAFISILRAGSGMLDGVLTLVPTAPVGHIGLYRDPKNYSIVEYYFKVPPDLENKRVIIIDPIIATGHSAGAAVTRLKECNAQQITFICVVASPEGIKYLHDLHGDVKIYTASVDEKLDAKNYVVPGVGDAGDRIFGTA